MNDLASFTHLGSHRLCTIQKYQTVAFLRRKKKIHSVLQF